MAVFPLAHELEKVRLCIWRLAYEAAAAMALLDPVESSRQDARVLENQVKTGTCKNRFKQHLKGIQSSHLLTPPDLAEERLMLRRSRISA